MISKIRKLQNTDKPLVCLTAYSYPVAKILDEYCDVILVGDSVAMTIYGADKMQEVSLDMMINHGRAVTRGAKKPLIVVDLPFGTYEKSLDQALLNAKRLLKETGCDAIKIECDEDMVVVAKYLVENDIPLMGHIGLLPQKTQSIADCRYQGRDEKSANKIVQTAKKLEEVGVFSLVIEGVPADLADKIVHLVNIPTIGIGASASCSGQILVIDDILGLNTEFKPKFVKQYGNVTDDVKRAVLSFKKEVESRNFPAKENLFS